MFTNEEFAAARSMLANLGSTASAGDMLVYLKARGVVGADSFRIRCIARGIKEGTY